MAFDYVNFSGLSHFYDKLKTKFSDINHIHSISTGGTGATTVDGALTNFGLNNVLVYDEKTTILPSVSKYWGKIAYGNGRLVAITENNSSTNIAAYSDDLGVTWHLITLPVSAPWYTVGFGNGRFVILPYNNSNKALYSDDGINWNSTTLPNTQFATSVCSGDGLLVATPFTGTNIMYSNDGITWTSESSGFGSADFQEIAFGYDKSGNGVFVATDSSTSTGSNKILYGKPSAWKTSTLPSSANWSGVAYGNGRFVITSSRANTAYSDDGGASWKSGGSIPYENYDYNFSKIAYGNNTFVALNMGISTSKVAYSKDYGINWTTIELPIYYDLIVWNDISFIDDRFIVITRNGEMLISFDGVNWSNEVPPMLFDMEGNNITNEIKSLVSSPSNNNILINSNFANPVNTKGQSSYEINNFGGYTIDGWKCAGTTLTFENNKYITLTPNQLVPDGSQDLPSTLTFIQDISNPSMYSNRVLTASVKYRIRNYENTEGLVLKIICDGNTQLQDLIADGEWHTSFVSYTTENITSQLRTAIGSNSRYETSCIDVEWIKLEEGSIATPYVAKHYAEELQLCRYASNTHIMPVNNNILINSNFANPVNQREIISPVFNDSEYSGLYCIDRWELGTKSQLTINENKSITLNCVDGFNSGISQFINDTKILIGKPVTLSAKINGKVYSSSTNALNTNNTAGQAVYRKYDDNNVLQWLFYVQYYIDSYKSIENFKVCLTKTVDCTEPMEIEWAKLELGEVATPYVPRLYSEELRLCKRYYQKVFVSFPITLYETNSVTATSTIPCEPMRIDKPTCDTTQLSVLSNGFATSGFVVDNCAVVTSQNKFYCRSNKNSHGLTLSNNVFTQGLLTMDAEI